MEESQTMARLSGLKRGMDELEHMRRGADLGPGGQTQEGFLCV